MKGVVRGKRRKKTAAATDSAHPEWLRPVPFARIRFASAAPRNEQGGVGDVVDVVEGMVWDGMGWKEGRKNRRGNGERTGHTFARARERDGQGRGITPPLRRTTLTRQEKSVPTPKRNEWIGSEGWWYRDRNDALARDSYE
ncbi:hypothetical protein AB1N83_012602 [Pleurotus pulmonarius]